MSKYLHNLAARTLKLTPVVQPRVASLFEPLPRETPTAVGSVDYDQTVENSSSTDPVVDESASRSFKVHADKVQPEKKPETVRRKYVPTGDDDVPKKVSSEAAIPNSKAPPDKSGVGVRPASPLRESVQPQSAQADAFVHQRVTHHVLADSSAVGQGDPKEIEESQRLEPKGRRVEPVRPVQIINPRSNDREQIEPVIARPRDASVASIALAQSSPTPSTATRRAFAETMRTNDAPPAINVTIGRIDVRAVFSQPSPPPRARRSERPAAMSLGEYLKQRNEGHR